MNEGLGWADASLQAVGKAVPVGAARQSRDVTGSQHSGLLSPALPPALRCATFDKSLRKSLSNQRRYN